MPRTILITGTSGGIGLATAVELAGRGERVFASMRNLDRAGDLIGATREAGVSVDLVQLDVTDPRSVEDAVSAVLKQATTIDVVVNNAGIATSGPLEFTTDAEVAAHFETNAFGPLRLIRTVLPVMRSQGFGRIVNISSGGSHSRLGSPLLGLYAASKAALNSLSAELLKEVGSLGIEIVLMDGAVFGQTAMTDSLRAAGRERYAGPSPYKAVEKLFLATFGADPAPNDSTQATARLIADACTIDSPPFIFPPEHWTRDFDTMPDEVFLRLCRHDPSPELYEKAPFWWQVNRTLLTTQ